MQPMLGLIRIYSFKDKQSGVVLLVLMIIIAMAITAAIYSKYNSKTMAIDRDKKTTIALSKAKEALIYFSLRDGYLNPVPTPCGSLTNCPRPGDLPCPDRTNDGLAELSCGSSAGSNQAFRLNRLPWRDLGLGDLTDGYGERLWYAVSNNYKNNTRTRPLNSDTVGTINVRDSAGRVIYDARTGGGVVAVIFSAGNAITRQDGVAQSRTGIGVNVSNNYLDNANGEDNANFIDINQNGFISGPVKDVAGNLILNDRMIVITRDEMAAAMETYVLTQVRRELLAYYNNAFYYPYPALFNDVSCIVGIGVNINAGCDSVAANYEGRIPVSNIDQAGADWPNPPASSTSILKGLRGSNWFQQNLWRELIYYAISPDCEIAMPNCTGVTQRLTLSNALTMPINNKDAIVVATGRPIGGQTRVAKTMTLNYLEADNISPADFVYGRATQVSNAFNDRAMSIP